MTELRERDWGISSFSLYGILALTPWIAPPSLDHGVRGVFVLPIRAVSLTILTLRARSEPLA